LGEHYPTAANANPFAVTDTHPNTDIVAVAWRINPVASVASAFRDVCIPGAERDAAVIARRRIGISERDV